MLLRFCEAIYPPAEPSNLQSHRARSIMTQEEFDVFHRARGGVADYFHQCGSRRARSAKFARFLEHEVRANARVRTPASPSTTVRPEASRPRSVLAVAGNKE
ncbi:MAG: hypothetical protein DME07_01415 [Candidatus Rokuibacteriota bacterium]|nr:MAG: hypothetical protein DME07_01415 [Candidatus Rokubacteria bacterium]